MNIYKPSQPNISEKIHVSYRELEPLEPIKKYIHCYWQLATEQRLDKGFIYNVIPDGCIDILWSTEKQKIFYLSGFSDTHSSFPLSNEFTYFGVRFLPLAFPLLTEINTSKLIGEFIDLKLPYLKLSNDLGIITKGQTCIDKISTILDDYFINKFIKLESNVDSRLVHAVNQIYLSKGHLAIESEIDVGLSIRQLRRLFKQYIGTSPKTFSQIVKFQSIYQMSEEERQQFYYLGYYDQPHFIKSFKKMTGSSPRKKL